MGDEMTARERWAAWEEGRGGGDKGDNGSKKESSNPKKEAAKAEKQNIRQKSKDAKAASAKADKEGTPEAHKAAAQAHREAVQKLETAKHGTNGRSMSDQIAKQDHRNEIARHESAAQKASGADPAAAKAKADSDREAYQAEQKKQSDKLIDERAAKARAETEARGEKLVVEPKDTKAHLNEMASSHAQKAGETSDHKAAADAHLSAAAALRAKGDHEGAKKHEDESIKRRLQAEGKSEKQASAMLSKETDKAKADAAKKGEDVVEKIAKRAASPEAMQKLKEQAAARGAPSSEPNRSQRAYDASVKAQKEHTEEAHTAAAAEHRKIAETHENENVRDMAKKAAEHHEKQAAQLKKEREEYGEEPIAKEAQKVRDARGEGSPIETWAKKEGGAAAGSKAKYDTSKLSSKPGQVVTGTDRKTGKKWTGQIGPSGKVIGKKLEP